MLEIRNLAHKRNGKQLIHGISAQFMPGKLYGIVGPNGSGKTTLLKTLCGIWPPSHGEVLWNGENLLAKERLEISRILSLVPQNSHIHFDFSVEDVVAMGRYPVGRYPLGRYPDGAKRDQEIIDWALSVVDVSHLRLRKVTQISSGERQRVYIARALATESPILLLDEPTNSLDIKHQFEIWRHLRLLTAQGKLVIVSNHDLQVTKKFCERLVVLSEGRCVGAGPSEEILSSDLLQTVFGVTDLSM